MEGTRGSMMMLSSEKDSNRKKGKGLVGATNATLSNEYEL